MIEECPFCKANSIDLIWIKNNFRLVKCASCDLAFIQNPPSEQELTELYSFNSGYMKHYSNLDNISKAKWADVRRQCELLLKHRSTHRTQ